VAGSGLNTDRTPDNSVFKNGTFDIHCTPRPCPAETTTQTIDPRAPSWLNESPQNTTPTFPDAKSQSQPEFIATLCANDEFRVWLKAQHSLPERDARAAKFAKINALATIGY
jgi:hypothetical protein